jgi:phasin family protein
MAAKAKKVAVAEVGTGPAGDAPLFSSVNYDEFAEAGRQNFSALLKSNEILTEGLEAIGKEFIAYARASFESASQAASAFLAAKTFDDVVQLTTDLTKSTFEAALQRSAKLSEMGMTVANDALAPLGTRVEAAISKFTKPVAA